MDTPFSQVARLGDLPKNCFIAQFLGRHVDEAVENAVKSKLDIQAWFEQKPYGKSRFRTILVAYKNEHNS